MENNVTESSIFLPQGSIVRWLDPDSTANDGRDTVLYLISKSPSESDYEADELESPEDIRSDAVYLLIGVGGGEVEALHHEIKLATDDERQAFYISCGASHCPYCLSYEIEGGFVEAIGATASQSVQCDTCGVEWEDTYQLQQFSAPL